MHKNSDTFFMHCDLEDEMLSNTNKLHSNRKWKVRAFQNAPKSSITPSELPERALQLWGNQYFPKSLLDPSLMISKGYSKEFRWPQLWRVRSASYEGVIKLCWTFWKALTFYFRLLCGLLAVDVISSSKSQCTRFCPRGLDRPWQTVFLATGST